MQLKPNQEKFLRESLPFWSKLNDSERDTLLHSASVRSYSAGDPLNSGPDECMGLILVMTGQVRAYILSESGKEITMYRLFDRDMCMFAASCTLQNINFDMYFSAEQDCDIIIIPPSIFDTLMHTSLAVAAYMNQLMSSRFSDVMWVMEQVVFMSFDKRLAIFLLEQAAIEGSDELRITHEAIARHMGTAREVVTRMLKYFHNENAVRSARGAITITNRKMLERYTR